MHVELSQIIADFDRLGLAENMGAYAGVVLLSLVKYFLAVVTGLLQNYSLAEIFLTAGLGGVVSSVGYIYFGHYIRLLAERFLGLKPRQRSFSRRRKIVRIWRRYGLAGTAFLIPILSPQICIGVAIAFREKPLRILSYVSASMVFWIVVCFSLKETVLQVLGH